MNNKQGLVQITIAPIKETTEDYDALEAALIEFFRKEIYIPIMAELGEPRTALTNEKENPLLAALKSGRLTFHRGTFSGRLSAAVSKELKRLGATLDRRTGSFKIQQSSLPREVVEAISVSEHKFLAKIAGVDKKLAQILPEEIADKLKVSKYFDTALYKVQTNFAKSVKSITVAPQLSDSSRRQIADEWQTNMKLWVKDFTEKQIKELRKDMQASVFAGNRFESAIGKIQKSYGVSQNKAKFLARQETSLLMAKFKETRYKEVGANIYRWCNVHKPKDTSPNQHTPGNVRFTHAILDQKLFSWDHPNEVNEDGSIKAGGVTKPNGNKNPGEDYNCRCFPKPIVTFKAG